MQTFFLNCFIQEQGPHPIGISSFAFRAIPDCADYTLIVQLTNIFTSTLPSSALRLCDNGNEQDRQGRAGRNPRPDRAGDGGSSPAFVIVTVI